MDKKQLSVIIEQVRSMQKPINDVLSSNARKEIILDSSDYQLLRDTQSLLYEVYYDLRSVLANLELLKATKL